MASSVWILTQGERGEGSNILGVYADRDSAQDDYDTACTRISRYGPVTHTEHPDGHLTARASCDIVTLQPHTVQSRTDQPTHAHDGGPHT